MSGVPAAVRRRAEAVVLVAAVLATALVTGVVAPSVAAPPAPPAAGAYDASFGDGGVVRLPRPGTGLASPPAVPLGDLQLDVASGTVRAGVVTAENADAVPEALLAAVDSTGRVETRVPLDLGDGFEVSRSLDALVPDARGGHLLGGRAFGEAGESPAVRRYDADGVLDACWGNAECGGEGDADLSTLGLQGSVVTLSPLEDGGVVLGIAPNPWDEAVLGWQVVRLDAEGYLDETFGERGLVIVPVPGNDGLPVSRVRSVLDGSGALRTYVVGAQEDVVSRAGTDVAVARLIDNGSLDTDPEDGFGPLLEQTEVPQRQGWVAYDLGAQTGVASSADDVVTDVLLDRDGGLVLVGGVQGEFDTPVAARLLLPHGELDTSFGGRGTGATPVAFEQTEDGTALGVDEDAVGRLLVTGAGGAQSAPREPALARLVRGRPDGTFGNGGSVVLPCPDGGDDDGLSSAHSWAPDGTATIVALGWCDGDAVLVRLLEDSALSGLRVTMSPTLGQGSDGPGSDDLALEAAPWQVDGASLPEGALDEALAELQASPLRYSPLRYSPLRYSPLRYSPLRYSPLRYSPLRYSPVEDELAPDLPAVTLAQVPLLLREGEPEVDWAAVLAGTPLADLPLQTVLVSDVLQLLEDSTVSAGAKARIAELELDQLDLSRTGWGDLSLGSYLLGGLPLSALPVPDAGSWCDYVAQHGGDADCSDATLTLPELEAAGVDLEPYYAEAHSLVGVDVGKTPLGAVVLVDLHLPHTRVGDVPVASLAQPDAFCDSCTSTLGAAWQGGQLDAEVTVADLLDPATGLTTPERGVASLGDLLLAVVVQQGVPFEALDLDPLLDALDTGYGSTIRYDLQVQYSCDVDVLEVEVPVPDGAELVGTPLLRTGMQSDVDQTTVAVLDPDADVVRARREDPACTSATDRAVLAFEITRPRRLSDETRQARVTGGGALLTGDLHLAVLDPWVDRDGERTEPLLEDEQLTVGFLGEPGDTDAYRLPVTPGQVVDLTLSQLPADYDLVVYAERPPRAAGDPHGVPNAPLRYSPLRYSPLRYSPVDDALPGGGAQGSAPVGPETLVGVDVREDLPVVRWSANRGRAVEAVRVPVRDDGTTALVVEVAGFDAAHGPDPYVLHTEVEGPDVLPPCAGAPTGTPGPAKPLPVVAGTTRSLLLVHHGRLAQLYGAEQADRVWDALQAFAAHPSVLGTVLDVGADADVAAAYAAWDGGGDDACSARAANDVVTAINGLVDEVRLGAPELRHLTLVGSDTALPMGRVPDLTEVANQREYAPATRLAGYDNPVSRAFGTGYLLSDDPYGALAPSAFLDTQLYVPDLAVGRLVETPEDIVATLQQFLDDGGVRDVRGAFVASYDFLADLGEEVRKAAADIPGGGPVVARNDEDWTRRDAREGLAAGATGLSSVNAHYDNNRALPADQNAHGKEEELLSASTDLPAALPRGVLATVGCNAGVNLSDLLLSQAVDAGHYDALPAEERQAKREKDTARVGDWAQRVSARRGVLLANTGFGYGDAVAIAYSERLLLAFARNLDGSMTLGQALQFAKQELLDNAAFGVYDHKALQEATLFGLTQWRVGPSGQEAATVLPSAPSAAARYEEVPVVLTPSPTLRTTSRGSWYGVGDEEPQVTAFRPVQPRTVREVAPSADNAGAVVRGALLTGLTTRDVAIDPVVSVPVVDSTATQPEPATGRAFFPSVLPQVVSRTAPGGGSDRLVLVAGQYRDQPTGRSRGVQRLVTRAEVRVTYGDGSADPAPPAVLGVDVTGTALRVLAPDAAQVLALVLVGPGGGQPRDWQLVELAQEADGSWTATLPAGELDVLVQAADVHGDVTTHSEKAVGSDDPERVLAVDPDPGPGPGPGAPAGPTTAPPTTAPPTTAPPGSEAPVTVAPPTTPPTSPATSAPQRPSFSLDSGTVTVGGPVVLTGTARPGSFLRVRAYSRPSTEYRTVRWLTVPADGRWTARLFPRTNTRLFASADGVGSDSAVVLVRPRARMTARPLGDRTVLLSGRVEPFRAGTMVSVYRRSATGPVLTAQAVTDRTGWWGLRRRFLASGPITLEVVTNGSLVSATGRSAPTAVTVR